MSSTLLRVLPGKRLGTEIVRNQHSLRPLAWNVFHSSRVIFLALLEGLGRLGKINLAFFQGQKVHHVRRLAVGRRIPVRRTGIAWTHARSRRGRPDIVANRPALLVNSLGPI